MPTNSGAPQAAGAARRGAGRWLGLCLLVATVGARSLAGQADSLAAAARAHYRDAVRAASQGDWGRSQEMMDRAHAAWPTQIAYLAGGAEVAAHRGDTVAVAAWLERIARMGLTIDLDSDSSLRAVAAAASLAPIRARLEANRLPMVRSSAIATDAPADFYPEGVDYDPKSPSFLIASVRKRTVLRVWPSGKTEPFLRPGSDQVEAVLAVRVDPARERVWIATRGYPAMEGFRVGQPTKARVMVVDRRSGRVLAAADAPDDGAPHWFGDLVLDRQGNAYLTDSESPLLFRAQYRRGRIQLGVLLRHRLFRSLQGLVFDASGRHLYLADYSHGLLRVTLADKEVEHLAPPAGTTLLGIDGMVRSGSALIAIQNGVAPGRVVRIDLDGRGRPTSVSVIDRHLPIADEPTIGTLAGDRFVYVANSQWEKYGEDGMLKPGAQLKAPVLLSLPLEP